MTLIAPNNDMDRRRAITGVDHLLVGVADLEDARGDWLRLGFTLTPRGRHIGWGTANYCIMFPKDYIELLGIIDSAQFTNNLDRFLETRQGLLGVAFATDDAEAAAETLRAASIAAEGPKDLSRILELPEGEVRPAFKLVHLPRSATPDLSAFIVHHLTPELVWRRDWCLHPNGARRIAMLVAVVRDPSAVAIPYGELFGLDRVFVSDGFVDVDTGGFVLRFITAALLPKHYPGLGALPEYPEPWLAAMHLTVSNTTATARYFDAARLAYWRGDDAVLRIAPSRATGVIVEFAEG